MTAATRRCAVGTLLVGVLLAGCGRSPDADPTTVMAPGTTTLPSTPVVSTILGDEQVPSASVLPINYDLSATACTAVAPPAGAVTPPEGVRPVTFEYEFSSATAVRDDVLDLFLEDGDCPRHIAWLSGDGVWRGDPPPPGRALVTAGSLRFGLGGGLPSGRYWICVVDGSSNPQPVGCDEFRYSQWDETPPPPTAGPPQTTQAPTTT